MKADLPKTELTDRVLWYDGYSTVTEEYIIEASAKGDSIDDLFVNEITPALEQYNRLVPPDKKIEVKTTVGDLDLSFDIPKEYADIDVNNHVAKCLKDELDALKTIVDGDAHNKRVDRTRAEYLLYQDLELLDVLRALIYVINTLRENNIVWGVGRGSSVASYILYLIGVHDVDSVAFDLDIKEFLRTQ